VDLSHAVFYERVLMNWRSVVSAFGTTVIRLLIAALAIGVSIPVAFLFAVLGGGGSPIAFTWLFGYVFVGWSFLPLLRSTWFAVPPVAFLWIGIGLHALTVGEPTVRGYPFPYWIFASLVLGVLLAARPLISLVRSPMESSTGNASSPPGDTSPQGNHTE
jgi:hypothetical protein